MKPVFKGACKAGLGSFYYESLHLLVPSRGMARGLGFPPVNTYIFWFQPLVPIISFDRWSRHSRFFRSPAAQYLVAGASYLVARETSGASYLVAGAKYLVAGKPLTLSGVIGVLVAYADRTIYRYLVAGAGYVVAGDRAVAKVGGMLVAYPDRTIAACPLSK